MSGTTTITVERVDQVLWIRLNRPEARNAIDPVMRRELEETLLEADLDVTVRSIVLTGTGTDFCTGADLRPPGNPNAALARPGIPLDARRGVAAYQQLFKVLWELETPVLSAVNGTVAGAGWLLALLADLVVAVQGARWTHAFSKRGMVPHCGDPFFLPRILPFHRLLEVALLSDPVTSEVLAGWGAVNRVVPVDDLAATVAELADRIAAGPTRTLGMAKRLYRRSLVSDMATSFAEEAAAVALISQTDDRREGVRSLIEGRRPRFTGN